MRVELDEKQGYLLLEICRVSLLDLRAEIVRTDNHDFRESLKQKEKALRDLLLRLEVAA
jgi:hypothetical protein